MKDESEIEDYLRGVSETYVVELLTEKHPYVCL